MKLKKLVLGLATLSILTVQTCAMAQDVSDSDIRAMVQKYKSQNYLGCIEDTNKIINANPSNIYAHYYKGLSYYQIGDSANAQESFGNVIQINSNKKLVDYAVKATACTQQPDACETILQGGTDLDKFVRSNMFYDKSVQAEINKKKLDRIRENINDEVNKLDSENDAKSEMPTNEEIASAVKTLAKLGFNPMNSMNMLYQNPEMAQMSMLLGNNTQQNNGMDMLPYLMMGQNGTQKMSPDLIQTMMMNQMNPLY